MRTLSLRSSGSKLRTMNTPLRIASLISSATEILYLLGLEDRVVGVSHECDYPPLIAGQPRLTRSLVESASSSRDIDDQVRTLAGQRSALYAIDTELLASLAPDLIITQAQCDVCAVRYEDVVSAVHSSPELAGTQVLALNPSRLADVLNDIRRIGVAAGMEQKAAEVIGNLTARVDRIRQLTSALPASERPRVACLEWIDPPMLAANWTPELVAWAGGNDGLPADGRHSSYANWNTIAQFDPEVIVIMPCGFDVERAIVEAQVLPSLPQWTSLAAVRADRVYAADGNAYFNRSGPRLVDSLEILAHLFHPTQFPPPLATGHSAWCRLQTLGDSLVAEQA
jgi:iron complex transport system substrate-binding protein